MKPKYIRHTLIKGSFEYLQRGAVSLLCIVFFVVLGCKKQNPEELTSNIIVQTSFEESWDRFTPNYGGMYEFQFTPVFGGLGSSVSQAMYLYFDNLTIQDGPF